MEQMLKIPEHMYFPKLYSLLSKWDVISSEEKELLLHEIEASIKNGEYPFYQDNHTVILFYKGLCENVSVISDITGWDELLPMTKLNGTDLYYIKLELEPDARIQYQLIADDSVLCDPNNKFVSLHGLGSLSEFAMPGYVRHPYFNDYLFGKNGSYNGLIKHILPADALPYEHEVYVYLPPEYDTEKKYPVIYFQDGPDYIRYALAHININRMILEKIIEPCIAVFVTPPNLHLGQEPNRSTEYGLNDAYVNFFCDELVCFIDANYSTLNNSGSRFVAGDSYAGLISFYIAFSRTELFANAYSQSGYFSFNNDRMIKYVKENPGKNLNLVFDIGSYEEKVGSNFLPANEIDFLSGNRRLKKTLEETGYNFIYNEYHEGHTWGNWRRHLIDALIHFLGKKGESK